MKELLRDVLVMALRRLDDIETEASKAQTRETAVE
jgi:hypothetical protein